MEEQQRAFLQFVTLRQIAPTTGTLDPARYELVEERALAKLWDRVESIAKRARKTKIRELVADLPRTGVIPPDAQGGRVLLDFFYDINQVYMYYLWPVLATNPMENVWNVDHDDSYAFYYDNTRLGAFRAALASVFNYPVSQVSSGEMTGEFLFRRARYLKERDPAVAFKIPVPISDLFRYFAANDVRGERNWPGVAAHYDAQIHREFFLRNTFFGGGGGGGGGGDMGRGRSRSPPPPAARSSSARDAANIYTAAA